jgi:hypothetical protein
MNFKNWWNRKTDEWTYRYLPKFVDILVAGSTARAQNLLKNKRLRILVDSSVLGHSITHETAWISTGPQKWGDIDVDTGYAARIGVYGPDSDSDIFVNVRYLPGIAHLVAKGHLEFCTSAELQEELYRQPSGRFRGYGSFDHNLFSRVQLRSVDGYASGLTGPRWMGLPTHGEQQQARLESYDDPLYLALVRAMGPKNNLDAWHICTAERHGMHCFLTMDFKLVRITKANCHREPFKSLKTRIMTPKDLAAELGLMPISPLLFSYHGASYHVRPDLHWPDNKRRRPTRRSSRSGTKND